MVQPESNDDTGEDQVVVDELPSRSAVAAAGAPVVAVHRTEASGVLTPQPPPPYELLTGNDASDECHSTEPRHHPQQHQQHSVNFDTTNNNNHATTAYHRMPDDCTTATPICTITDAPNSILSISAISTPLQHKQPPPLPTRNRALPDIDDVSMNAVFSYMDHYKVDLFWSFLSDSCFIAGSLAYMELSIWDFIYHGTVETEEPLKNRAYIALDVLAPLVFLGNSFVDIQWATRVQQRLQKDKHRLQRHFEQHQHQQQCAAAAADSQYYEILASSPSPSSYTLPTNSQPTTTAAADSRLLLENNPDPNGWNQLDKNDRSSLFAFLLPLWCFKLRKHTAHRRTVWAALMFGVAASLAMSAAILRAFLLDNHNDNTFMKQLRDHDNLNFTLDLISDHVYVVSALISLTGKRNRPFMAPSSIMTLVNNNNNNNKNNGVDNSALMNRISPWLTRWCGGPAFGAVWNDPERLEDLGDLLFLIGSLVDAVLADARWTQYLLLDVVSSFLWLLDGCLYMQSDFVKAAYLREAAEEECNPSKVMV